MRGLPLCGGRENVLLKVGVSYQEMALRPCNEVFTLRELATSRVTLGLAYQASKGVVRSRSHLIFPATRFRRVRWETPETARFRLVCIMLTLPNTFSPPSQLCSDSFLGAKMPVRWKTGSLSGPLKHQKLVFLVSASNNSNWSIKVCTSCITPQLLLLTTLRI